MNRTIGGLPILYWAVGLGVGVIGFLWIKKRSGGSTAAPAAAKPNPQAFTQAQEVQDFQVFSALTGAQQASDLNFLSEVAGLFSGGSSTGTPGVGAGGGGTASPVPVSAVPSPPSTGTVAPATTPASSASSPTAAWGSTDPQVQQAEAILAAAGAGSGPNGQRRAVA